MRYPSQRAFTLIEVLVVVSIIVVLFSVLVIVGGKVVNDAKARDSRALLQSLQLAVDQFQQEAPLKGISGYVARYGNYPPDELEVFSADLGIPGGGNLAGGSGQLEDENGTALDIEITQIAHRDVKAMALAIQLYGKQSATTLAAIDKRFVRTGTTLAGDIEYYDKSHGGPNDDKFREPLIYFVDAWGVPIAYFATRVAPDANGQDVPTSADVDVEADSGPAYPADGARRIASSAMVRANNGAPILVSYGPDGEDQLSADMAAANGEVSLVWDFYNDYKDGGGTEDRAINHRLNHDNVYPEPELAERLAKTMN